MGSKMNIELKFSNNDFNAIATITPAAELIVNNISFILNKRFSIAGIYCNRKITEYSILNDVKLEFRSLSHRINIPITEHVNSVEIHYSGTVERDSDWYNTITNDIKSLSSYSVWYPQETSIEIAHDKVTIVNGSDYFVVKGIFDEDQNIWEYGDRGFDPYNIVAYKKEAVRIISNSYMNIYFVDEKIEKQAEKSVAVYKKIINYYNGGLFTRKEIPVLDVACTSPAITTGGGYRRKDLMWCTDLGNSDEEIAWLNAHETAHIWCTGADPGTWEDWLNETTAEWSSLLFALKSNNTALFDFILKPKLERYSSLPPIKTIDCSRPEGVHDKGTVMFYNLYKKHGVDYIEVLLKTFIELKTKATDNYLETLCDKGYVELAAYINKGILE